jgi:hypothetical protein
MPFLVAAVVVLAVLCLGNLLLLFAVLRRLRGYEERLVAGPSRRSARDDLVGRRLPAPAADLVGRTGLVGVFSASCQPCHEQAALFAGLDDPARVALVLDGSAGDDRRSAMLATLAGAPRVLTEPDSGTIAGGLGIRTYPVLLRLDGDGTVLAAEHSLAALTAATR